MIRDTALRYAGVGREYSLYGILFFITFSIAGIEIFAVFAFLSFILWKRFNPDFTIFKSWTFVFLLLFIIFSSLSLINSGPYLDKSSRALIGKWCKYAGIFLFVADSCFEPKRLRRALTLLLVMSGFMGIDALFQRFVGFDFFRYRTMVMTDNGLYGVTASFTHFNGFGAYLVVVSAIAVGQLLDPQQERKPVFLALAVLLVTAILMTFSRGSWLGIASALLFLLFVTRRLKLGLFLFSCFTAIFIFIPEVRERLLFTFQLRGDADRYIVWQSAWQMIRENPFLGKGIGTFMDYFNAYTADLYIQYAHNCYLQIWAESGIFALLSFLLFIASIIYRGIRVFLKSRSYMLLGLLSGVFGFAIHSFFDVQLYSVQLAVFFWVVSGMTLAAISIQERAFDK